MRAPPTLKSLRNSAPVFTALQDDMRLRWNGHHPASDSKHLGVLAAAALVRNVKVDRERLWEFDPSQMVEARRFLDEIAQQWEHALAKLKRAVES